MAADDIVTLVRMYAERMKQTKRTALNLLFSDAADEIERLRAERDQLRAEIVDRALGFRADVPWNSDSKARMKCEAYAADRGWIGLYDKINKRVAESEVADG